MYYYFLELFNLITFGKLGLFIVFSTYVWMIWIIKYYFAKKYRPYATEYNGRVSVVIPVLKEDPEVFKKCLSSIKEQDINPELIIAIDGANDKIEAIANKYADKVIANKTWRGKRPSIMDGFTAATGDILVLMDSDSYFDNKNGMKELIRPFADTTVGGVTTKQQIFDEKRNTVRRFANWMEMVRFSVGHPAQSYFGGVGCLPGRAIAIRKEYIMSHKDQFLNDWFMGEKSIISDDRALTGYLMKDGYKTLFQSTALVYTDSPNTWGKFIKQQLRWARGSQRETLRNIPWLIKQNKFTAFCFITDIITPIFFISVVFDILYRYLFEVDMMWNTSLATGFILGSIGMLTSLGARQSLPIDVGWDEIMYLPLYCLFLTFVQTPLRLYGLMTCYEQGWMTR